MQEVGMRRQKVRSLLARTPTWSRPWPHTGSDSKTARTDAPVSRSLKVTGKRQSLMMRGWVTSPLRGGTRAGLGLDAAGPGLGGDDGAGAKTEHGPPPNSGHCETFSDRQGIH